MVSLSDCLLVSLSHGLQVWLPHGVLIPRCAGYHFVNAVNDEAKLESIGRGRKNQGRLLYAAFAKDQGKVTKATFKAIETATTKFNSSLKRRIGLAA